jgi:hypothetical protein
VGEIWEAVELAFGYGCGEFGVACGVILDGGHICQGCWVEVAIGEDVALVSVDGKKDRLYHQQCLPREYAIERLTG